MSTKYSFEKSSVMNFVFVLCWCYFFLLTLLFCTFPRGEGGSSLFIYCHCEVQKEAYRLCVSTNLIFYSLFLHMAESEGRSYYTIIKYKLVLYGVI